MLSLKLIDPWNSEAFRRINPLCKIPALVLGGDRVLADSRVIIQYINDVTDGSLIPSDERRWEAMNRESLAHGLTEAVIRLSVERLGPESERVLTVIRRQEKAIAAILDWAEANTDRVDAPSTSGTSR